MRCRSAPRPDSPGGSRSPARSRYDGGNHSASGIPAPGAAAACAPSVAAPSGTRWPLTLSVPACPSAAADCAKRVPIVLRAPYSVARPSSRQHRPQNAPVRRLPHRHHERQHRRVRSSFRLSSPSCATYVNVSRPCTVRRAREHPGRRVEPQPGQARRLRGQLVGERPAVAAGRLRQHERLDLPLLRVRLVGHGLPETAAPRRVP